MHMLTVAEQVDACCVVVADQPGQAQQQRPIDIRSDAFHGLVGALLEPLLRFA